MCIFIVINELHIIFILLSLFNSKEVRIVLDYIDKVLKNGAGLGKTVKETDIGVVTPYKLQSKIISRDCRRMSLNDITVGTTEVFQGQEKAVMIVSTVCTGGFLGFVKDPRVSLLHFALYLNN